MLSKLSAAIFILVGSVSVLADDQVSYLVSPETKKLNLPFSDAVRVNNMIFMSGQLGVEPGSFKLVEGGIENETRQIFKNMKGVLESNESSLSNIVKCTVMMGDIGEWPKFNQIYVTYFPDDKPARSAFGANGLALGASVEMECWAVVN
ncbi:MAG TPA: Rid family detoxifying hydrolase [Pseudomonadales bacterium]|jgi:reactive intermediate/imine deaminase|nr:Rid family detoxifying hydrolase [Pseudomonadales bacterium]HJP52254.1 Rid family detoxifying hydrolase [Pseudomonadales bacterium]|tara:strand:- start:196 stop:642 length:447 start_codon:yes stop_codon:yes gene_type:complete